MVLAYTTRATPATRAASRTLSVPRALTASASAGRSATSSTSAAAARCTTASQPFMAVCRAGRSSRSPRTVSTSSVAWCSDWRTSKMRGAMPAASRRSTTCEPMKPAPPVTRTLMRALRSWLTVGASSLLGSSPELHGEDDRGADHERDRINGHGRSRTEGNAPRRPPGSSPLRRARAGWRRALGGAGLKPGEDQGAEAQDGRGDPVLDVMVAGPSFVAWHEGRQGVCGADPVEDGDRQEDDPDDDRWEDEGGALGHGG